MIEEFDLLSMLLPINSVFSLESGISIDFWKDHFIPH